MPIRKMYPQGTLTPNQQKKKGKRQEEGRKEVEEVLIQDGAKVGKDPDAHTRTMAEVGCYSDRENQTLMGDIDVVKERVARDQEERERLEKEREELERREEERKKKHSQKRQDEAFGKIFRVTMVLGRQEMRKIEKEEQVHSNKDASKGRD